MSLLEISRLAVSYGKALALDGITLTVEAGEIVGVLGPNGAGKSTLMKAISGSVPWSGEICFKGESFEGMQVHEIVARGVCHCPEGRRLFPELSVYRNLCLGAYLQRDSEAVKESLEKVYALFPMLHSKISEPANRLSGGQQQMVAIARALMGRPALLLLDEPSVGIAHGLKTEIFAAIKKIRENGTSVLLVEQDARAALKIVDRAYVLEHGRIAIEGIAENVAGDDHVRGIYLGV